MFGNLKSYEALLGGVTKNASGHIVAAKSLHNFWMTHVNFSAIDMDKSGNMAGTAEWVPKMHYKLTLSVSVNFLGFGRVHQMGGRIFENNDKRQ